MVDSHAHLVMDRFDADRDDAIHRAREAGITRILTIGTTAADSLRGVELARSHPGIRAACGIHPHEARTFSPSALAELRVQSRQPGVVAIGEIGLDFHYDLSPREKQEEAFRRQIGLALEERLPVVVHSREAEGRTLEILREEGGETLRGVLHCFTGTLPFAERCLSLGLYISFSGILTFRNAGPLREIAAMVPGDRILVETDSPYLAPEPLRGRRSEPAFLPHTVAELARVRGVTAGEIARLTEANFEALFERLPAPAHVDRLREGGSE